MEGHEGGWRVPGYTEIRRLGTGGSGQVVLARRIEDDFPVAIKYLSDELRSDLGFVAGFRHEARLLALLRSPYVAQLYEYIESAGGAAIIMELVDGVSLRALLRTQGPTGPEAALVILKGALLGLAEAHLNGVVHRDFKPENIIVDAEGNSKIVDFGIALRVGSDVGGAGTPAYMAPEQWSGGPATPATDVYAATIVFFECVTGVQPFRAQSVPATARLHQAMPPPVDQVPEPLRDLIERGMAKHPADRPPSAEAFATELETIAATAYGPDWEERGRRRLARLAGLLSGLFPLGETVPETATTLAETHLTPSGTARRFGAKIALGAGAVVAVIGATAIVAGLAGDTELTAHSAPSSPETTLTTGPTESEDPGDSYALPSATPEDSASAAATTPAPTPTATAATTSPPSPPPSRGSASPRPSPTPTRTSARPSARPTVTPTTSPEPEPEPEEEPELRSTQRPRPRSTATPSSPSATPTRTATRPPVTGNPRPTRTAPAPTATATVTSEPTVTDSPTTTSEPTIGVSRTDSTPGGEPIPR
jgi:Serine/threonine protein kinase